MISEETATRLCGSCGLCCNGVLFFSARLQPEDPVRKLEKLGLKIKRRDDGLHMLQPCTAHRDMSCRVYRDRPTRCRLFVCRQLQAVAAGERTEDEAEATIAEALKRVAEVKKLLRQAGDTREHKALTTRYESLFTDPLDEDPSQREAIRAAMRKLEEMLEADFRVPEPPCPP